MHAMPIKEQVGGFLRRHTGREGLGETEDVFSAGYVNSLFAMQLVLFVEKSFGIRVLDGDLDRRNFCSIEAIERFVSAKLAKLSREAV